MLTSLLSLSACKSGNMSTNGGTTAGDPTCAGGQPQGSAESGVCAGGPGPGPGSSSSSSTTGGPASTETDVGCGGPSSPKCVEGKHCLVDSDCEVGCSYANICVGAPSCKTHLGGDTCGKGEVGEPTAQHESCCRTLPVAGYTDPLHPGHTVYLDKYEITAGRIRQWVEQLAAENGGNPDVKSWISQHRPLLWDPAWEAFLPTDREGGTITITRRLLGDPRPEDSGTPPDQIGPGVILPPSTDQSRHLGTNYQFGSEIYVDLHGNNCATWDDTYGFPTFYYPADILARNAQLPRADGLTANNQTIPAQESLDVKAMNCVTNAMMAAFCAWDGGQLATTDVLDYVTATPPSLGNISGCGTQRDDHGELLGNIFTNTIQSGGRCAPVGIVNATFDAGDTLPVPGSSLNTHNYWYPDLGTQTHDKSWEIAPPGRGSVAIDAFGQQVDVIQLNPGDEPWMDLHGNLNEAAFDTSGGTFSGHFALKYRGIAYGSSRSDLNMTYIKGESILRLQRPEAKAAYSGGRCMRFK
jgi:hypothetical protein